MAKGITLAPAGHKIILGMKHQEDLSKIGAAQEEADVNADFQNHPDPKEKSGTKTKSDTGTQTKMKNA